MKIQLKNPEHFNLTSVTIEEFVGDGFQMKIQTAISTDVHVLKTLTGIKSMFTKQYGKGASWEEVENFTINNSVKANEAVKNKTSKKSISEKNTERIKAEQSTIPFDIEMTVASFEIEPSENEKEALKIKAQPDHNKKVVTETIAPLKTEDSIGMNEFSVKVGGLINLSSAIKVIENDIENNNALEVAKDLNKLDKQIDECRKLLNKPLDTAIKSNNALAKKISTPLTEEIERLKKQITTYQAEKERKRIAEAKKIQDEKEASERLKQAEIDRVARIKGAIERMDIDLSGKIESVKNTTDLDEISSKLKAWQPREDYYQEFMPNVKELVVSLDQKIKARYGVIKELEKALAKGDAKKLAEVSSTLKEIKKQEDVVKQEKQSDNELTDFQARQQLISLFSSVGVEDVAANVERVIKMYGSAQYALLKKDDLILAYQNESESNKTESTVKESGMKSQRVDFTFEVIDKSKLPLEFLKVDEVAIRAAIKEKRQVLIEDEKGFTIDGVKIKKELTTVLR